MRNFDSVPRLSRSLSSSESTASSSPREGILDMQAGAPSPSNDSFKKQQGKYHLLHTLNLDDTPFQKLLLFLLLVVQSEAAPPSMLSPFQNRYH